MSIIATNLNYNAFSLQNTQLLDNLNLTQTANLPHSTHTVLDKSKAVGEVLGYGVDEQGFFTSDFNEEIGLSKNYKIHSLSIENYLSYQNSTSFSKLDLEKTLQNAYKIFSQLIDEHKTNFSKEDLNSIPQAFDFNKNSLQITQKYNFSESEYKAFLQNSYADYVPSGNIIKTTSFFSFDDKALSENLFAYTPFNANESAYIDNDLVSKGGLFMAFLSHQQLNYYIAEGQTNLFGKLQGLDKNMSKAEVDELYNLIGEYNQYFDVSELYFHILRSDLSIEEFKELALAKKEAFLEQNSTQNANFTLNITQNPNHLESEKEDKKPFTPIQVKTKAQIYKDNFLNSLKFSKNQHIADLFSMLFHQKSSFYKELPNFITQAKISREKVDILV